MVKSCRNCASPVRWGNYCSKAACIAERKRNASPESKAASLELKRLQYAERIGRPLRPTGRPRKDQPINIRTEASS